METTRQALGDKFFRLMKKTWSNAFQTLQPDLWVGPETVCLDAHNLARVARQLNPLPDRATKREGLGPEKLSVTRESIICPDSVLRALAELEADPGACGPAIYHFLTGVVRRQIEDHQFYSATVPNLRPADGTDPACAALVARVEALDRARGVLAVS